MKRDREMAGSRRSFVKHSLALMAVGVPVLWSCARDENEPEGAIPAEEAGGPDLGADTTSGETGMSDELVATDGKASKAAVNYQDTPMGDRQCSKCRNFIAAGTEAEGARCKVVAGPISPTGYCDLYSPQV